jgi:hypothetical protein
VKEVCAIPPGLSPSDPPPLPTAEEFLNHAHAPSIYGREMVMCACAAAIVRTEARTDIGPELKTRLIEYCAAFGAEVGATLQHERPADRLAGRLFRDVLSEMTPALIRLHAGGKYILLGTNGHTPSAAALACDAFLDSIAAEQQPLPSLPGARAEAEAVLPGGGEWAQALTIPGTGAACGAVTLSDPPLLVLTAAPAGQATPAAMGGTAAVVFEELCVGTSGAAARGAGGR